jgi:hypothetical protein
LANVIHAVDRLDGESIARMTIRANEWLQMQDVPENGFSYEYVKEMDRIVALMIAYSG